ncbi:hypothetical protein POM88_038849 [Heracleum sosnowskyi]|uniref:Uncharacterized protein n=1 Tax=Heracleum sosnowskyi TaxID=360622 RepID=A0AAD8M8S3_9APIA|nr:hypothetical protein POM88_038849 [Heracleum sosnowskyi]
MENSRQYSFFDYEYHSNIFQTQNTDAGTSQTNEVRANFDVNFHQSQERQIEDIINESVRRSNAIYNLSEADDIIQEVDSDETEGDEDEDDSDGRIMAISSLMKIRGRRKINVVKKVKVNAFERKWTTRADR